MSRPIFKVGDRVAHTCRKTNFNYYGTVTHVIEPGEFDSSCFNEVQLKWYSQRDSDFINNPIYIVKPDSSPGPMTSHEIMALMPVVTSKFYDLIFNQRAYHCIESDLMSEEDLPIRKTIFEVNAVASSPDELAVMLIKIAHELNNRLALKENTKLYHNNTCTAYVAQRKYFPLETKHETS